MPSRAICSPIISASSLELTAVLAEETMGIDTGSVLCECVLRECVSVFVCVIGLDLIPS